MWRRRQHRPDVAVDRAFLADAASRAGYALGDGQVRAAELLATGAGAGVYIWGPVGRGKTWLMGAYHDAVPTSRKRRVHFHEFFLELHAAIRRHGSSLEDALDELLRDVDVLCFDEFHVHDVGDGVFIRRMLLAILARPVRLIVTSNYPPDGLMPNPLYHGAFLPTIELIKRVLAIIEVGGDRDYRIGSTAVARFATGRWTGPGMGSDLERPLPSEARVLRPAGHPISALRADHSMLWISFPDLCAVPTAASDYLALAQRWNHWVISDVPTIAAADPAAAQRFATVVDVLYDRDIRLDVLADGSVADLLERGDHALDGARMLSRLGQLRTG